MEQMLLRIPEAAKVMGLGRTKMYELVRSGDVPSVRFGRSIRIPTKSLVELIEQRTSEAEEELTSLHG